MPQYDKKGRLTRAGAEQAIREGGSVAFAKRIYTKIEDLPSHAEFAKGDTEAEEAAKAILQQQIASAQAQLASLEASTPSDSISGGDGNETKRTKKA